MCVMEKSRGRIAVRGVHVIESAIKWLLKMLFACEMEVLEQLEVCALI